jgi:hypothetical protein
MMSLKRRTPQVCFQGRAALVQGKDQRKEQGNRNSPVFLPSLIIKDDDDDTRASERPAAVELAISASHGTMSVPLTYTTWLLF